MRHASLRRAVFLGAAVVAVFSAAILGATDGRVTGTVMDEAGAPIEGAAITVTTQELSSLKIDLTSDAQGRFATAIPNVGLTYDIRIEKAGFAPTLTQAKAAAGKPADVPITLHPPIVPPAPKVDPGVLAYNEGVELIQKGDKAAAEKKFLEAVAAKPDLGVAWKVLAELAYERKDYAATLAAGRKALESDPSQKDLFGILTDAAQKAGDAPAAADYRKRYREANADKPEVNYNAGVEDYNAGQYEAAAADFGKTIQLKPDMANAYFWLAMCEYNMKKYSSSKANFQKYLELAPTGDQAATAKEMLGQMPAK